MKERNVNIQTWKIRSGQLKRFQPTDKRIELRKNIVTILDQEDKHFIRKIDEIIDYIKGLYKAEHWHGLNRTDRINLFNLRCGVCMWCGIPLSTSNFTVEHIKPRSEGGTDDIENLGIACSKCNNERDGIKFIKGGYLLEALKKYNPYFREKNYD